MKIMFGRHSGKDVAELPLEYCEWLLNHASIYGDLQREVAARLGVDIDHLRELRDQVTYYKGLADRWQQDYAEVSRRLIACQQFNGGFIDSGFIERT